MAQITLTDILGTDNVSASRTVINQNFQSLENSINNLENYLNTTPAGGSLSIASATLTLGSNNISTNLLNNQGSALIQGNLTVNQGITAGGTFSVTGDFTLANGLYVNGSGPSAEIIIGSGGVVPLNLKNIVLLDEKLSTTVGTSAINETVNGSGIFSVDPSNLRCVVLDYTGLGIAPTTTQTNIVEIQNGVIGQRLVVNIGEVGDAANVGGIYFSKSTFNSKYNAIPVAKVPFKKGEQTNVEVEVAIGFEGFTSAEFQRKYVELVYKSTGWEVYNGHPLTVGI